ncbi:MAG: hypothetical protein IKJ35_05475 [Clostridia bacterium]|nr:hypothetical protein [Clostridia bacterium]
MDQTNCTEEKLEQTEAVVEQTAEAPVEQTVSGPVMLAPQDFELLKTGFKAYYDALLRLIKNTKDKDVTISKITRELQKYREGFAKSLKKPIALSLLSFLEDNKKTLRELEDYAKDRDNVLKYLDYLLSDLESVLELYDIRCEEDGSFTIKLSPVKDAEVVAIPEVELVELPEPEGVEYADGNATADTLLEYLKQGQARVETLIQNNAALDANLTAYTAVASLVDRTNADAVLMPIYRKLVALYKGVARTIEEVKELITDENFAQVYRDVLEFTVESCSDLLTFMDVTVLDELNDEFDSKTCKILKVLPTEDAALDKKIAARHTSAYLLEGALIYPAKVSVYKLQ